MLDSHPKIAIPPETHFIIPLLEIKNIKKEEFIEIITNSPTWGDFNLKNEEFKFLINQLPIFDLPNGLKAFYSLYANKNGKDICGDKTPTYILKMHSIANLFPDARFIHIIRDGRDVALSYKNLWFGPGRDIKDAAQFWMERIQTGRNQAIDIKYYHEVRYEDLVLDPVGELTRISDFLDITFCNTMLDYPTRASERLNEFKDRFNKDGTIRIKKEDRVSLFNLVNHSPDPSRISRYKNEMTDRMQYEFELIAGPLLSELGYETRF
jgi:hypothetical protein